MHQTQAERRRISAGKAVELYIRAVQSGSLATEICFRDFQLFSFLSEFMTLKGSTLMATEMEILYSQNMSWQYQLSNTNMPQVQLCAKEIIAVFTFFHDFAGRLVAVPIRARGVFYSH